MAHFALINKSNNIVENVIVIANEEILDENGNEQESLGVEICKRHFGENYNYLQCSYNDRIRGKYPAIGETYDQEIDAFMPVKPFDYFVFDENNWEWVPPNRPQETEKMILDDVNYTWSFSSKEWVPTPINFNPPSLTEDEVENYYYYWDHQKYIETQDVESSYIKVEIEKPDLEESEVNT